MSHQRRNRLGGWGGCAGVVFISCVVLFGTYWWTCGTSPCGSDADRAGDHLTCITVAAQNQQDSIWIAQQVRAGRFYVADTAAWSERLRDLVVDPDPQFWTKLRAAGQTHP